MPIPFLSRPTAWVAASLLALVASPALPAPPEQPSPAGKSRALIVVGLPGDAEHDTLFVSLAGQYRDWLTKTLDFDPADVRVLFGKEGKEGLAKGPATREALQREAADLKEVLKPEDRLWVLFVGHGNRDGDEAFFHMPGRDVSARQLAAMFAGLRCREQVFWMTFSASGWFLKPLSAKGRIVLTATLADDEFNETEFPEALASVIKRPAGKLDTDGDGKVSLLELFRHIGAEVQARFDSDKRVPTEHALLDDNGDGEGAEKPLAEGEKGEKDEKPSADGRLAARTFLPFRAGRPRD
jgi:hypothetical protein